MNYPTDQRHGAARAASATWAWILAICTFGYMLPWAIAAHRGARNSGQVFWLNLLLGWTLIGWVVALVMGLRVHQPVAYPPPPGHQPHPPVAAPAVARNPFASNSAINNRLRNNPTAMKVIPVFAVAAVAALIIAIVMPGDKDGVSASPSAPSSSSSSTAAQEPEPVAAPETDEADEADDETPAEEETEVQPDPEPEPAEPSMTAGQSNAVRKAESYLELSAFSRKGLIDQLKFEGFSAKDAAYGVDHVDVDWNEQAAKKAQSYLDMTAFSRSGLIEQLEFEGFTAAQARHGVTEAGL